MAQGDMENIGIKDLTRAKTLDGEAHHYWRDRMMLVIQAREEFGCFMRRARGILTLIQETGFRDVWGVEDLIDQVRCSLYFRSFVCCDPPPRYLVAAKCLPTSRSTFSPPPLIAQAEEMIRSPEFADSNLFHGVNYTARRQQVVDLRMQLALSKGDTYSAAKMAIKMLVEDEVRCSLYYRSFVVIPHGGKLLTFFWVVLFTTTTTVYYRHDYYELCHHIE